MGRRLLPRVVGYLISIATLSNFQLILLLVNNYKVVLKNLRVGKRDHLVR